MAEREKADLLHDAISLARSEWMVVRTGVDPSASPFLGPALNFRPMAATKVHVRPKIASSEMCSGAGGT